MKKQSIYLIPYLATILILVTIASVQSGAARDQKSSFS